MFLAASALAAANTLNARRPLARHGGGSVLAFATGWPTSKLPLHAIAGQALAAAAPIRRGSLRHRAGWVGLGLCAVSWATLARIYAQATAAGDVSAANPYMQRPSRHGPVD